MQTVGSTLIPSYLRDMIDWVVRMQISSASTISQSHTDGIIEVVIELADLLTTLKTIPH